MARHPRMIALLGALSVVLAAASPAKGVEIVVIVTGIPFPQFIPKVVTIQAGDTVRWDAPDEGPYAQPHNVVSDDDVFFNDFPKPGPWSYSFQFTSAGTFPYYCEPHGNKGGVGQSGIIFVRPARPASEIAYERNAWDFEPVESATATGSGPEPMMRFVSGGTSSELRAGVQIPAGAKIAGLEITGCDDNASQDLTGSLVECPDPSGPCTEVVGVSSSGSSGCDFFTSSLPAGPNVNNLGNTYALVVNLGSDDTLRFRNARVFYRRSVSPPPLTAMFGDVPAAHPFFRAIEALAAAGVTQGCGSGNYCPDDPVTRAAMAGFLARAFGLFWPN